MHRNPLKKLLSSYQATSEEDFSIFNRFRDFINSNSLCFSRSLTSGHVTGSAWIVDKKRRFALFAHHKKLDMWLQLGGHCDDDPNVYSVALKEAEEESGLLSIHPISVEIFDLDIHTIPKRKKEGAHDHYDARFLFEADRSEKLTLSEESKELAWIEIDKIEEYTKEPSILRMAEKTKTLFCSV